MAVPPAGFLLSGELQVVAVTKVDTPIKLISKDEMLAMVGVSYAAIWGWIKEGKFPPGRSIGFGKRGHVAWVKSEVQA